MFNLMSNFSGSHHNGYALCRQLFSRCVSLDTIEYEVDDFLIVSA